VDELGGDEEVTTPTSNSRSSFLVWDDLSTVSVPDGALEWIEEVLAKNGQRVVSRGSIHSVEDVPDE
jgi:hypothetical protein